MLHPFRLRKTTKSLGIIIPYNTVAVKDEKGVRGSTTARNAGIFTDTGQNRKWNGSYSTRESIKGEG